MKVTQEIDALTTMGISPLEFLVLPRVTALFLMIPLLCVFADCLGILGGAFVAWSMLNISLPTYLRETKAAITLTMIFGGIFKAAVYGVIIAVAVLVCTSTITISPTTLRGIGGRCLLTSFVVIGR